MNVELPELPKTPNIMGQLAVPDVFTSSQMQEYAKQAVLAEREKLLSALNSGFDGSSVRVGPNHSTIQIWYDTEDQACAAHSAILDIMDAAAIRQSSPNGGIET